MWPVAIASAVSAMYYTDYRSLAHTYGIWVLLGFAVSYGRPTRSAVVSSVTAMTISVVVFFCGLKVFHDIKWAGSGSTLGVDWDRMALWICLALPVGVLLGVTGHYAPSDTWKGAASRAAVLGALGGEGIHRLLGNGELDIASLVDLSAAAVLLVSFAVLDRPCWRTAALTAVALIVFIKLQGVPDVLELIVLR